MGGKSPDNPVDSMERKREIMALISQETRHRILQTLLGHPAHLPTMAELDYMIPDKSTTTIEEAAENLVEGEVVSVYRVSNKTIKEAGLSARANPNKFYGLSEQGVQILEEFEYFRSVPILRAIYDNTKQTQKTQRHQEALRPNLPESIASALDFDADSVEHSKRNVETYSGIFDTEIQEMDEHSFDEVF